MRPHARAGARGAGAETRTVDWYCDRCNAYPNRQSGFDDNKYTWKCEECGHKNSISRDNVYESQDAYWGRDSDD